MNILCFPTGPYATNMYIICCENKPDAIIIDPGAGSFEMILEAIRQYSFKPVAIWLTHSHWDHIVDAAKVKRELSLPIYMHEEDKSNLENPGSDGVPMAIPTFEGTKPDCLIKDGDFLTVGKNCEKEKILFSGDTFYRGLIGSLSLPTSQAERMWKSLDKIATLPPDTVVYPGHGPSTKIKDESWLTNAKKMGVIHS
jgi:glyoxylase-like metal-dependent hydrolase (beta-lactamase superfamily II)